MTRGGGIENRNFGEGCKRVYYIAENALREGVTPWGEDP